MQFSIVQQVFLRCFIIILFLWLGGTNAPCLANEEPQTILVLHSFKAKRPWTLLFNRYLSEELQHSHLNYKLEIENLDLVEFNTISYQDILKKQLLHKYGASPPDIIIITFPPAADFVFNNQLFDQVPKILVSPSTAKYESTVNKALSPFSYDFKGNVVHALNLLPNTQNIYVVAGSDSTDNRTLTRFIKQTEELKDKVNFKFITHLSPEDTLQQVKHLPPNSLVYFLSYTSDAQGKLVIARDFAEKLGKSANAPVFVYVDLFALNTGVLGGRVTTVKSSVFAAVTVTKRVFQGENINAIEVPLPFFEYIYDWQQLIKWGADLRKLPPDSLIQNRQYTLWERYKVQIVLGIGLLILESFLILILILNIKRRRIVEQELQIYQSELEKKVEERTLELQRARLRAEAANQAKSLFLANMSHELRTPLNAVLGFAEILSNEEKDNEKKEYLDIIRSSGAALLHLINDILDMSKIEAEKLELQWSSVSIAVLFANLQATFQKEIKAKDLEFNTHIDEKVPASLILDETRVYQILSNLIGNALKFTKAGFVNLSCYSREQEKSSRIDLILEVEDSGTGIDASEQEKIFNAFEQARKQKTGQLGGTGLGLTISKKLVQMMHGVIEVKSSPGHGACFRVTLYDIEIAEIADKKVPGLKSEKITFEPSTILIADDLEHNRKMLAAFLRDQPFKFIYAANGYQTIEQAQKYKPDLILMDMKMPEMDGYEAAAKLKSMDETKKLPVIAVTASALKQDEEVIRTICNGYLRKPVSQSDLINKFKKYLRYTKIESSFTNFEKTGELFLPGEDELQKLYSLAWLGNMDEIITYLNKLQRLDEQLTVFCNKFKGLATNFCDEEILSLLKNYLHEKNNETAGR